MLTDNIVKQLIKVSLPLKLVVKHTQYLDLPHKPQ